MELETVLYRVEGNVGIVSLNRTKALNAMNKQIFVDLTTAFDAAEKDADAAKEILVREMESAAKLSVPLTVSSAVGKTWYDCKD